MRLNPSAVGPEEVVTGQQVLGIDQPASAFDSLLQPSFHHLRVSDDFAASKPIHSRSLSAANLSRHPAVKHHNDPPWHLLFPQPISSKTTQDHCEATITGSPNQVPWVPRRARPRINIKRVRRGKLPGTLFTGLVMPSRTTPARWCASPLHRASEFSHRPVLPTFE